MRRALLLAVLFAIPTLNQAQDQQQPAARAVGELSRAGERVDRFLSSLQPFGFSGAAVVALGDEVLLKKGYGLANRQSGQPMTPDTVSTMGSITKQFTAAGILKLADMGKLSADDPITKYFDDVPDDKRAVTLHQLLTHSSGFGEIDGYGDDDHVNSDQYVELAMATPLNFPPGEEYDYSNTGYSLLGIIIEKLSGQNYEQWLRDNVLLPAGVSHTGYQLADWSELPKAQGYLNGEHWGQVLNRGWLEDGPGWILRANGGLHTVLDDMLAWRGVVRGTTPILSEASRKLWITPHVDEGGGDSYYGYGWEVHPDAPAGPMIAHNGGNGIFSADFVWFQQPDLFVYITGNQSVIPAANLRPLLIDAMFNPHAYVAPIVTAWADASESHATEIAGQYGNGGMELEADHVNLLATIKGQSPINLIMGYSEADAKRFAEKTELAASSVQGLLEKDNSAFDRFFEDKVHAAERADSLINWIRRFEEMAGPLAGLEMHGTVRPVPGIALEEAESVTYLSAQFNGGIMVFGMNWDADGQYLGTAIGPPSDLPSAILVPIDETRWQAWAKGSPSLGAVLKVSDSSGQTCFSGGDLRLCRNSADTSAK